MTALPTRPLLLGLYHVVPLDADRVQVCNAGRSVVLAGAGLTERAAPLLAALDGSSTLERLRERFPDLVPSMLEALMEKGLLTEAQRDEDGSDGAPGLAATSVATELSQREVANRIVSSTVVVAGCGPVGAAVAVLLAKAGVGALKLIDPDQASPADVAVCPVLPASATGHTRAAAAAAASLASGRARCEVVEKATADTLASADLAVLERPQHDGDTSAPAAEWCLSAGKAYLLHGQDALTAVVGPLVQPGGVPCHCCAQVRRDAHVSHPDEHMAYLRHRARAAPRPDAFLAADCSLIAGLVAAEALRALSGGRARTDRAALVVDLAASSLTREPILGVPGCPGCLSAAATGQ